ncbi:hypothetical protein AVEN_116225-1 [Araneus ventricosus]|uniref:Uncharacterized protein n=1 Tax=Araneus ventricosus TaxID=182803 RepID=A0A4Y2M0G9_ARAVE|nr:hypothetical protein AVEN_116225-1 [Araneus ventricosus]
MLVLPFTLFCPYACSVLYPVLSLCLFWSLPCSALMLVLLFTLFCRYACSALYHVLEKFVWSELAFVVSVLVLKRNKFLNTVKHRLYAFTGADVK